MLIQALTGTATENNVYLLDPPSSPVAGFSPGQAVRPISSAVDCPITAAAGTWFVGHVRSCRLSGGFRHSIKDAERKAADELTRCGIANFLPISKRKISHAGVKREVEGPTWEKYIFFAGQVDRDGFCEERWRAVNSGVLLRWLAVPNQSRLIHQLTELYVAMASGRNIVECKRIPLGARCRVFEGPLLSWEGKVERYREQKGVLRVLLDCDGIGKSGETWVDADQVELLN